MKPKYAIVAFAISSIVSNPTAAQDLIFSFPITIPELNPQKLLSDLSSIDFKKLEDTNRGESASIFSKVAPSVVKVLTNEGSGSGVVISRDGFIVTNNHVIDGYRSVGVIFINGASDQKVIVGEVVRIDEIADLALLKVSDKIPGLIPISAQTREPEIGEDVHAIGHPFGEDWTYTRGYISQKRRNYAWQTGPTSHHVANVIQTQTPINPGNSGGPLINSAGEMIGINTFTSVEGEGINFALDHETIVQFLQTPGDTVRKSPNLDTSKLIGSLDENGNGQPDVFLIDESGNGIPDVVAIDANEDLIIEAVMIDENENNIPEIIIVESDDPQLPGILYIFDDNEDGTEDYFGVDFDRDGEIDEMVEAD